MPMIVCKQCGGGLEDTKTEMTREIGGREVTLIDVPAFRCQRCGTVSLKRPQDLNDITKDKAELVSGLVRLYFTNRRLYYVIQVVTLLTVIIAAILLAKYVLR